MGGFSSLATAVSGMQAAQLGLSVTGHNMSNSEIEGYSRQRSLQKDYYYQTIGMSGTGALKRGLGTTTNAIQQIRNQFLDLTYRTENGKLNFYTVKSVAGAEIEGLLGEMQGEYRFQAMIDDMWKAMQELVSHPDGVETRDYFRATCESFIIKANEVYNSLYEYQHNLDGQVRTAVSDINGLVGRINELNAIIITGEASGDYANDYRDERNLCLDKLSAIIPIEYREDPQGGIAIFSDGHQLLSQGSQNLMGLKYTSANYAFVEPVFTNSKTILSASTPPSEFESYINYNKDINADNNNDYGSLKGLLVARGAIPAYYNGVKGLVVPTKPVMTNPTMPPTVSLPDPSDPAYPLGATDPQYLLDKKAYDDYLVNMEQYKLDQAAYKEAWRKYEADLYNYQEYKWSIENATIPKTMLALDSIVNKIVTLINDKMAPYLNGKQDPDAPYDNYGDRSYVEVFVRNGLNRFDNLGNYNAEEDGNYYSQYSIGNITINPKLKDADGGYNYLALSLTGDPADTTLLLDILSEWGNESGQYAISIGSLKYNIQDAYNKFVTQLATEFQESKNYVDSQSTQVVLADNKRNSIKSVSLDEEMNNMMKYQYAYSAAARILNVIDGMLDKIINGMLR